MNYEHLIIRVPHINTEYAYEEGEKFDITKGGIVKHHAEVVAKGKLAERAYRLAKDGRSSGAPFMQSTTLGEIPGESARRSMIRFRKSTTYGGIPGVIGTLHPGDEVIVSVSRTGYTYKAVVETVFEPYLPK
jgi:hypothetical protein